MKLLTEHAAEVRVVRCYFEQVLQPRLAAMRLEWPVECHAQERLGWNLPGGVTLAGPAPSGFGVHLLRLGEDCYTLHLVWNQLHLGWKALTREQLEESCLASLLSALGTDLHYWLNQPIVPENEL